MKKVFNQKGYIALIAVLIILAVTLAIGLTLNILSIGETQTGLLRQQSAASFTLADGCVQEAYTRIKRDNNYTGGNLNITDGSCTITVTSQGPRRTITVESDINNIKRRIESEVRIVGNNIQVDYWQELF